MGVLADILVILVVEIDEIYTFYCLFIIEKSYNSVNFNKFYQVFKCNFLIPKRANTAISCAASFSYFPPTFTNLHHFLRTSNFYITFTNFFPFPPIFRTFYHFCQFLLPSANFYTAFTNFYHFLLLPFTNFYCLSPIFTKLYTALTNILP